MPPGFEATGEIGTAFAPAGQFGDPVAIPAEPDMDAFQPRVAMDRAGRTTLVWRESPPQGTAGTNIVRSATASAGEFGTPQTLDTSPQQLLDPAVDVARAGNAVSAWAETPSSSPFSVLAAKRGRRQTGFGAFEMLNAPGVSGVAPEVAANRKLGIAVWQVSTGTGGTDVIANVLRRR